MMKKFLTITLISCAATIGVQAQTKTLTFEDAVKIALRNGMLLNQQKNNLEYSQVQKPKHSCDGPNNYS